MASVPEYPIVQVFAGTCTQTLWGELGLTWPSKARAKATL